MPPIMLRCYLSALFVIVRELETVWTVVQTFFTGDIKAIHHS